MFAFQVCSTTVGSGAEQPTGDAPDPAVFEDVKCLPEVEECTASADEHPSGDEPLEITGGSYSSAPLQVRDRAPVADVGTQCDLRQGFIDFRHLSGSQDIKSLTGFDDEETF